MSDFWQKISGAVTMCKENNNQTLTLEPILVSSADAAFLLGISPRHFAGLERTGRIGPMPIKKFGARVLWSVKSLRDWEAASFPNREEYLRAKGKLLG